MPTRFLTPAFVKLLILASAVAAFIYFTLVQPADSARVSASASGPSPSHTSAPGEANCTACHADFPVNSGTGSVTISGVPANYLPNQQVHVTITTAQADAVIYGFQATALDISGHPIGTLTLQNPQPPTPPST